MKTITRILFSIMILFISSSVSADFYDFYVGSTQFRACTAEHACDKGANQYSFIESGTVVGGSCRLTAGNGTYTDYILNFSNNDPNPNWGFTCPDSCPSGEEKDPYTGQCVAQQCPDGQFMEGGECTDGCVAGAEIKLVLPIEQIQSTAIDPILGCDLELKPEKLQCNYNSMMCNVFFEDTGNYNDSFDAYPEFEPLPEPDPIPEPVSTETVTGPTVDIQQNPDGSTVKTETTEITQTNDDGQTLEIIGDSIVLKNKEGEIIDILQQITTNTYTDGSSAVTETTTTTATPGTVAEIKKNFTDGSTQVTTRTYQSGPSGTTVTTKTETFDPQGNSTGKTESTTGAIDEVGEEEEGDYSYQSPGGKDDLYQKSDKTFQGVLTNFVDEAQQAPFFTAATGFFETSTSGTCPVWTIPSVWVFGAMVIDAQCSQVMNQIWPFIAGIIIAAAGFLAFRWAFL